jgi:photosystem II stability/assembly factor-like uncharacterized protein
MPDKRVRVLVGTRKGAYVLEGDRRRSRWTVRGPFQSGSDVFYVAADPRSPGTIYSLANNGWWGPMLFRSRNWGARWTEIAVPQTPKRSKRSAPVEAPNAKYPIVNLWHLTAGRADQPKTVFLGVDPASLWRSDDEGDTWEPIVGLNEHRTRPQWNPGAGGMCLHTILLDPERPNRMHVGISAAGTLRTDDGGEHWTPTNQGVLAGFQPNKHPEVGQCVHKIAFDAGDSNVLYRQDHCGIYVSRNAGDRWTRVGRYFDDDFGMGVATAPALPGQAFFAPLASMARTMPGEQFQVHRWNDRDRHWSPLVAGRSWSGAFGMHREGLATDALDPAGVYLGTTTGQLFWTADEGRHWKLVPYQFPGIHSVEVAAPGR